ncbi:MAG: DUF1800 domain-containing protein [Aestuariivirga sp.]|nr:DUF1800 domain-containing protein [Aestuariivirga sp.]
MGPKPGGASRLGSSLNAARDACLQELEDPQAALITDPALPSCEECCRMSVVISPQAVRDLLKLETNARIAKHLVPEVGFVERLVLFWSNHFNVFSRGMESMLALMGNMERTAIRPHVLGKFPDMLKAVMRHPAMLRYLDNNVSMGPNSVQGLRLKRSYNENLAREILELHTLGVQGGYTQQDIINLALIITGWTVNSATPENVAGQFRFNPDWHEPGAFTVLDRSFAQGGIEQGLAALDMLARHPKTAEHIAFKLVQHFVTDKPTSAQVRALSRVFTRTQGDLKEVAGALLGMSGAWTAPLVRIRQPYLWAMAVSRALSMEPGMVNRIHYPSTRIMWGNDPWGRQTPDGYPDENYFWENANHMRIRLEAMNIFMDTYQSRFASVIANVERLPDDLLPGAMSPRSKQAVVDAARQISRRAGLAMLFLSPEFMRR